MRHGRIAMRDVPSLRRLWTMYKRLLVEDGFGRRDLIFAQGAFYAGARGVLKVLGSCSSTARMRSCASSSSARHVSLRRYRGHAPRKRRH